MAGDEFDMAKVNSGELTPMFFGSAMTNFGVRSFLEKFLETVADAAAAYFAERRFVKPGQRTVQCVCI